MLFFVVSPMTFELVCHFPQARSQFKSRSTANNVSILVPVPSDADSPKLKTSTGSAKWVPEKNVVQWNIKSFPVSVERQQNITVYNPKYSRYILMLQNSVVILFHHYQVIRSTYLNQSRFHYKMKLCFYDDKFKRAAIYNIMIDLPHTPKQTQSHLICASFAVPFTVSVSPKYKLTKKKTC